MESLSQRQQSTSLQIRSSRFPPGSVRGLQSTAEAFSFHVHVRQGKMCELVTPHVRQGGIKTAYVMVCLPTTASGMMSNDSNQPELTKDSPISYLQFRRLSERSNIRKSFRR